MFVTYVVEVYRNHLYLRTLLISVRNPSLFFDVISINN